MILRVTMIIQPLPWMPPTALGTKHKRHAGPEPCALCSMPPLLTHTVPLRTLSYSQLLHSPCPCTWSPPTECPRSTVLCPTFLFIYFFVNQLRKSPCLHPDLFLPRVGVEAFIYSGIGGCLLPSENMGAGRTPIFLLYI